MSNLDSIVREPTTLAPPEDAREHLVVIFAYHYPPENRIGGARPFRFAKYLSRIGYSCRVFTASEQDATGPSNVEYVPDHYVTGNERTIHWHLERAIRRFCLPGETGLKWSYDAARAARAHIHKNPRARVTILSTFPPIGCHLAARRLARGIRGRWIADFRDPMRNHSPVEQLNTFQVLADLWLERDLLSRADAVIANTDEAMVRWHERFPSLNGKSHLIWNGFDPEKRLQPLPTQSRGRKILTHTGELYGGRTATPILESISRLMVANRLSPEDICVRLLGFAEAAALPDEKFLNQAIRDGWLDLVVENIPQHEALQAARSSDALLLVQPQSSVQVPGKLFEYLQIGRPILAFVQPNSPAERILARSGVPYRCVYPGDNSEVADEMVAEFLALPSTPAAASPWFEEQFDARKQTEALHTLIQSLHADSILNRESRPLMGANL